MPITTFNDTNDGLAPGQRQSGHFIAQADPDAEEELWVPYADGVWFQPCWFNVSTGGFAILLKALPGAQLGVHYHVGSVHGYTMRGQWRYLEHDWIAGPGTYNFEPPGEAHTLVVLEDSPEPMLTLFIVDAALIYLEKPKDGAFAAFEDAFTALELCRAHYRSIGRDQAEVDRLIR
jgi:quercetin dioxygenase-like cupin family protein